MSTPIFITSDPEQYGEKLKQKLLGIGSKVAELRKSAYHRYPQSIKDPILDGKAIDRASISKAFAEGAKQDAIARSVRVRDRFEAQMRAREFASSTK